MSVETRPDGKLGSEKVTSAEVTEIYTETSYMCTLSK